MGIVVPFEAIRRARRLAGAPPIAAVDDFERPIIERLGTAVGQAAMLDAAGLLLDRCRDTYGFVVMQAGLPKDATILGRCLLEVFRGLSMLDREMAAPRTYPTYGVYFGRPDLAWFEDGYGGASALAVPDSIKAADFAAFVRPRLTAARSRSQE